MQDRKVLQTEKINAGARAGMENKDFLKCEIKKAIEKTKEKQMTGGKLT